MTEAKPSLIIQLPGQPAHQVILENNIYRLGRATDSDILVADTGVSRQHGKLERCGGVWQYTDLTSP